MQKRRVLLALCGATMMFCFAFTQPARAALVVDPSGDVFNTGTIDIVGVTTTVSAGSVQFMINFASAVSAPSAFAANSVLGFVDLDTDQNSATGGTAPWGGPVTGGNNWINFFIPPNPGTPSIPGPLIT